MLLNYHIGRIVLGSMCVLEFRCGRVGVVSVLQAAACTTDTTTTRPHRNSNTHRTKNNATNVVIQQKKSQALDDGYINLLAPELFFLILAHPVYKM